MERLEGPLLVVLCKFKKSFRPFAICLLVLGVDESWANLTLSRSAQLAYEIWLITTFEIYS